MLEVTLERKGKWLTPADQWSEETLDSLKQGERLNAKLTRPRNYKHLSKYMSLMNEVFKNQTRYATMIHMRKAIEMAAGHFETIIGLDGKEIRLPASVSYQGLSQEDFEAVYDSVINIICSRILPNTKAADLKQRIEEIIGG